MNVDCIILIKLVGLDTTQAELTKAIVGIVPKYYMYVLVIGCLSV